jgi:hypothetical protein
MMTTPMADWSLEWNSGVVTWRLQGVVQKSLVLSQVGLISREFANQI